MFESVSIEFMSYFAGSAKVKVWVEGNELHYSKSEMRDPINNTKDSVSSVSAMDFIKRIEALKILGWRKSYYPVGYEVMDGETWTLKYEDSEHKTYKIEGDNEYPENWTAFMELMTEVAGHFWDYEE